MSSILNDIVQLALYAGLGFAIGMLVSPLIAGALDRFFGSPEDGDDTGQGGYDYRPTRRHGR